MADWLDCIDDPRAIRAVFGDHTPPLQGITLHSVKVDLQLFSVELDFDLPEFPIDPPVKWRKFNTVALRLRLYELSDLHIDGLPAHDVTDVLIEPDGEHFRTTVRSSGLSASVRSRWIDIGKMSAYQRIPDPDG
ncbi:MAG TPA: Imm50 family immunity protein [Mycobacteriales bacterium]|nr:Imm50 family immunity protein [Mycobacteriales bacterium]